MIKKTASLNTNGYAELLTKMAQDYLVRATNDSKVPDKLAYTIVVAEENPEVKRNARLAVFNQLSQLNNAIVKQAFDTRRIDQEHTRNPRENLQYWNRSDQFITDENQEKINIFAKLIKPLDELKLSFGAQPEWHNSYARVLYDSVYRILRIKEADLDIFQPQLTYLEQLMFNRYRLSMDELSKISESDFKNIILKKDENLLKRGAYLYATKDQNQHPDMMKNGDGNNTHQSIINAIFGGDFRKDGEKVVERTITITIRDEVK